MQKGIECKRFLFTFYTYYHLQPFCVSLRHCTQKITYTGSNLAVLPLKARDLQAALPILRTSFKRPEYDFGVTKVWFVHNFNVIDKYFIFKIKRHNHKETKILFTINCKAYFSLFLTIFTFLEQKKFTKKLKIKIVFCGCI